MRIDDDFNIKSEYKHENPDSIFSAGTEGNAHQYLADTEVSDRKKQIKGYRKSNVDLFLPRGSKETADAYLKETAPVKKLNSKNIQYDGVGEKSTQQKASLNRVVDQLKNSLHLIVVRMFLYVFNGMFWQELDVDSFTMLVKQRLSNDVTRAFSSRDYSEMYRQLRTDPKLSKDPEVFERERYYICFKNGVYSILEDRLLPHAPNFYFQNCINADFVSINQEGIYFERYIDQCSNDDPLIRQTLLEMIGYIISDLITSKSMFLLLGDRDCGKSTFGNFILELIGQNNAQAVLVQSLGDRFTPSTLEGKKLALDMDVSLDPWGKKLIGNLKKITGHDRFMVERKFKNAKDIRIRGKILLAANHLPNIGDAVRDDAFLKRLKIIPFGKTLTDKDQDPYLLDKLLSERNYIIAQAMNALRGLIRNGFEFSKVYDYKEMRQLGDFPTLFSANEIVLQFIEECCTFEDKAFTYNNELYAAYLAFIDDQINTYRPLDNNVFSKVLLKVADGKVSRLAKDSGRGFSGIRILTQQNDTTTATIK